MPKKVHEDSNTVAQPVLVVQEVTSQVKQDRNLYIRVVTRDGKDNSKIIGERIVDLYHFGTRNWMHNHGWWAMHNGHILSIEAASPDDVSEYLSEAKIKLSEKFNKFIQPKFAA